MPHWARKSVIALHKKQHDIRVRLGSEVTLEISVMWHSMQIEAVDMGTQKHTFSSLAEEFKFQQQKMRRMKSRRKARVSRLLWRGERILKRK